MTQLEVYTNYLISRLMYLVSSDEWDDDPHGIDEVGLWPAFFVIHLRVFKKGRR